MISGVEIFRRSQHVALAAVTQRTDGCAVLQIKGIPPWKNVLQFRVSPPSSGMIPSPAASGPSRRTTRWPSASPKLIRYFVNAGLGAGFLLWLSHRGSAQADAANGFLADLDRNSAAERNYVGKHPLPAILRFGEFRPLGGRLPEGPRCIGLAASQFRIVRRCPIALKQNPKPPKI